MKRRKSKARGLQSKSGRDRIVEQLAEKLVKDYVNKLTAAGFEAVSIEPTRVYQIEDARAFLTGQGMDVDAIAPLVDGKFMSAFVRASKPALAAATKSAPALNVLKCC